MVEVLPGDFCNNFVNLHGRTFGLPGGIRGVTPDTAQVATTDSDEGRRNSRPDTFALDGVEYFGYAEFHGELGVRSWELGVGSWELGGCELDDKRIGQS